MPDWSWRIRSLRSTTGQHQDNFVSTFRKFFHSPPSGEEKEIKEKKMPKRKGRAPCGVVDNTWSQAAASEARCLGSSDVFTREERSSSCDFQHTCHNKGRRSFSLRSLREKKEGQTWKKKTMLARWIGSRWWEMELRSDAAGQRQQQPIKCLGTSRSFVSRRFILASCPSRSFPSLSLSSDRCLSAVRCPVEKFKTQANLISSWTPSKRNGPKRKQRDAIVQ